MRGFKKMMVSTSVLCIEKMLAVDPGTDEIRNHAEIVKEAASVGRAGTSVGSGNESNCPAAVILTNLFEESQLGVVAVVGDEALSPIRIILERGEFRDRDIPKYAEFKELVDSTSEPSKR